MNSLHEPVLREVPVKGAPAYAVAGHADALPHRMFRAADAHRSPAFGREDV